MDVATHFHPRARASKYLNRERSDMPDDDSGGDSESLTRRKFQRTTADSDAPDTFRKPSAPASATRPAGLEQRSSVATRRRSTLRENVRVPSGPRDLPGSPGKRVISTSSTRNAPAMAETTNTSRSFLPESASEPFFTASHMNSNSYRHNQQQSRTGFGQARQSSTDETNSPITSADFAPTMNFDDFQNSITDPNWSSPILNEFPTHSGGRALPKEDARNMARGNGYAPPVVGQLRQEGPGEARAGSIAKSSSFRRRMSVGLGQRQGSEQPFAGSGQAQTQTIPAQSGLSLRTRRQSGMPGAGVGVGGMGAQPTATSSARPPRKSVGPGLITSLPPDRKDSQGSLAPTTADNSARLATGNATNQSKIRRTTMQPSASAGAELPRLSTLTATTQSRANKVKSLQPPPRSADPDTPANNRAASKGGQSRAQTPSSSGRRQSTVSGRASGLGARTISPTDARRLKRLSMHAPPMPSGVPVAPPTPQEDMPNHFTKPDLPRFTQPSPSFIPLKMSTASTPTSARDSPEGKAFNFPFSAAIGAGNNGSGVPPTLSAKSSYQSLVSANSGSRLPTPKPRRNSYSRTEQYGQDDDGELVPPVPAIPKAFGSPKEQELSFLSSSLKASHSSFSPALAIDDDSGFDFHSSMLPAPTTTSGTPRSSMDVARATETPRERSGEQVWPKHRRTNTNGTNANGTTTTGVRSVARAQPDSNGRRNNNLQPLRLPPLNLMPISSSSASRISRDLPRPTQEIEGRDDYAAVRTPEPRRNTKTPSTPMTASKATFFRRRADEYEQQQEKIPRASSSHFALRDLQMDFDGGNTTRFFDDSDVELATDTEMPIPNAKQRSTITPFSSGSLPKGSGEFARYRQRPNGEYQDDYDLGLGGYPQQVAEHLALQSSNKPQGPRPRTTGGTANVARTSATPNSIESPVAEQPPQVPELKKEKEGSGLRRKLSLGWRRSSSKNANHPDNKSSPQQPSQESFESMDKVEKQRPNRLQKRSSEMPPPKLPASATWTGGLGDIPSLSSNARPSLEAAAPSRRKSTFGGFAPAQADNVPPANGERDRQQQHSSTSTSTTGGVKTRSQHSEHPQPVPATRASSWGNFGSNTNGNGSNGRSGPAVRPLVGRHKQTASTISAIVKDKDDLAADEEMRRLSTKRKDVDSAARESEAIKARAVPRSALSPERVLHETSRSGGAALNIFERGEIMDYEKDGIYFTGTKNAKKIIGSLTSHVNADPKKDAAASGNYGYDDERGDYNIVLGDHLSYRYEVVDLLGKGSFGQVVRCVDHKNGGVVAVKIIRNKKRFHQQALVEVGILGRLGEWDPDEAYATLSITRSFYFRSHLCIVTPCLSINLYEFIRAHNFVGFSLPLIRRFGRQLLACLVLLQQKRIIHCDLKPENILLCEARKADVRVIDFGSSCREEEKVYTYIQSRFYRSPEVILGSPYGLGIDMWSLGCILAELWTGYPIFPGENEQEQLACIMEIFGPPDRHLVERCTRKKLFFDSVGKPRVTVSSKGRRRRPSSKTLQQALKTDDEAFVDFVARCLRWDPDRRMKPHEAVVHPFITSMPLSQRPGIPEEARRPAARVRSQAAVPTVQGPTSTSSPVKQRRDVNATVAATPAGNRNRALPETPQTAVRHGGAVTAQASPSKNVAPGGANRRHSTLISTGGAAAAVAGNKRASNGVVLGAGGAQSKPPPGAQTLPNLAQMAASASMGGPSGAGAGAGAGGQRWRT